MISSIILAFLFVFLLSLLKFHRSYFKRQKIPFLRSNFLTGTFHDFILQRKSIYDCTLDIYHHPSVKNEAFFGIYLLHKKAIFLKDPKLIKQILVRDANYFSDRMATMNENDPLHSSVGEFVTKGQITSMLIYCIQGVNHSKYPGYLDI
jgi:hypothetical protein